MIFNDYLLISTDPCLKYVLSCVVILCQNDCSVMQTKGGYSEAETHSHFNLIDLPKLSVDQCCPAVQCCCMMWTANGVCMNCDNSSSDLLRNGPMFRCNILQQLKQVCYTFSLGVIKCALVKSVPKNCATLVCCQNVYTNRKF